MPRRLNFTGRRKINRADVAVALRKEGDGLAFDADFRLGDYDLDPEARVHVEAYRSVSTQWRRFEFGRVSAIVPPDDRSLPGFDHPEGILFRLKIATDGEAVGRLVGEADRIRPTLPDEVDQTRRPLIDVAPGETRGEVWRLDFTEAPLLVLSQTIEDWPALAMEPRFRALTTPTILRRVLEWMLVVKEASWDEEDPEDPYTRWLRFAESLPGVAECPGPVDRDGPSVAEVVGWIDDVVAAFCTRLKPLEQAARLLDGGTGR